MSYYTNEETRLEIDAILKENARIHSKLGKDSTPLEIERCKRKQNKLFSFIKKLDAEFYDVIVVG